MESSATLVSFWGFVAGCGSATAYSLPLQHAEGGQTSTLADQQTSYSNPHFDSGFTLHQVPVIVGDQRVVGPDRFGGFKWEAN